MTPETTFEQWLCRMPKAELHLHIDGTLQPQRMLALAAKNAVEIPYGSVAEVEQAYSFENLQSFLDLYYAGASVLREADDFYHLMMDYLQKCRADNVVHTEIMVEPQTYAPYGVRLQTVMEGFTRAIADAERDWGQSTLLILSCLRHLSEAEALATLDAAEPFREHFSAVGLASSERGNPPEKFANFYRVAAERGYHRTVHAGEEGPAAYIWTAINQLKAERIDHGVRCTEDEALVEHLRTTQLPLTVCPLSNVKLCVYENLGQHPLLGLLDRGLCITISSDDPAYFGGYCNDNWLALARDLALNPLQAASLAANSFKASFLPVAKREQWLTQLHQYGSAGA